MQAAAISWYKNEFIIIVINRIFHLYIKMIFSDPHTYNIRIKTKKYSLRIESCGCLDITMGSFINKMKIMLAFFLLLLASIQFIMLLFYPNRSPLNSNIKMYWISEWPCALNPLQIGENNRITISAVMHSRFHVIQIFWPNRKSKKIIRISSLKKKTIFILI
jgi:hypothetical protein